MNCDSDPYRHRLPLVYLILVLWVLMFPVALFAFLLRLKRSKRLREELTIRRWGFLYATYQPRFYWFEIFVLVRRAVISCAAVLLLRDATGRSSVLTIALVAFLVLHFTLHPYAHRSSNMWDAVALVSLLVLNALTAGHSILHDAEYSTVIQAFSSMIVIIIGGALLLQILRRRLVHYAVVASFERWVCSCWCCLQASRALDSFSNSNRSADVDASPDDSIVPTLSHDGSDTLLSELSVASSSGEDTSNRLLKQKHRSDQPGLTARLLDHSHDRDTHQPLLDTSSEAAGIMPYRLLPDQHSS